MKKLTKLKNVNFVFLGTSLLMLGISACSSEDVLENVEQEVNYASRDETANFEMIFANEKEIAMRDFSIALVKSLNQSLQFRQIIKNEAEEAINLDPEVLIYKIKNLGTETGTVESLINSNLSGRNLYDIFEIMPTLTVLVPELPEEEFNAENWDTSTEIPAVAVRLFTSNDTPIILSDNSQHVISKEIIPAFPVVVVKENERIISNRQSNFLEIEGDPFFVGENFSFKFSSPYFSKWFLRPFFRNDQKLVDAYNFSKDIEGWQRDYIYYGIEPANPNGPYTYDYSETIGTMTTEQPQALYSKISEQTGDPFINPLIHPNHNMSHWKDGGYEFCFRVTSNSKAGAGQAQNFKFPVRADQLFELEYERGTGLLGALGYFTFKDISSKSYNPNIPTIGWNLETKATEFIITIFEEDSTEEINQSISVDSEFATNFGIDINLGISEIVKLGLKFGGSTKNTRSNSISVKKTLITDDLGDYVINFQDKVILSETVTGFGNLYPKRFYGANNGYIKFNYYPKAVQ